MFTMFTMFAMVSCSCFTMPPKVIKVSSWAFSIPNVDSYNYVHETHMCPNGYELYSQYSNMVTELSRNNIIHLNIYGYSVCCD